MHKIKCILMIAVLVVALTACENSAGVSTGENNSDSEFIENSEEISASEEISEVSDIEQEQSSETADNSASEQDLEDTSNTEEVNNSEEELSEEESIQEEPAFSVEACDMVLFVKKAVNVRKGPSTDYEKIGGLSKGDQIQVTGIADTGWYQIQYNGAEAYVSSSYLIDETSYQAMIAEEEAAALAAQQAAQQAAAEQAAQQQVVAQQPAQGDYKAQVVAIMNQERAAAGIGGISHNASLDAVAQIRAQEIVQSFAHTRPNGSSCFTVLDENGVVYMVAGENIAAGYGDPASVMNGWMNSEGHRANILNGSFGQVGIGYYTDPNTTYGTYWVQIFTN